MVTPFSVFLVPKSFLLLSLQLNGETYCNKPQMHFRSTFKCIFALNDCVDTVNFVLCHLHWKLTWRGYFSGQHEWERLQRGKPLSLFKWKPDCFGWTCNTKLLFSYSQKIRKRNRIREKKRWKHQEFGCQSEPNPKKDVSLQLQTVIG